MESLNHFYNRIISWDNLIKKGYFNIVKDKRAKNVEDIFENPYAKYDSLFAGYFNLKKLIDDKIAYNFIKNSIKSVNLKKLKPTIPILYTIPKDKNTRRPLKYPNFYSYCVLINELVNNKEKIINKLVLDRHSMSKFFNYSPYNFVVTHRMQDYILVGNLYFFKTDFSTFYPSFYTHALAWLIEGKKIAKQNQGIELFGNKLDKLIEREQENETHGIPTGNLITNIIIEYAMSFFDEKLEGQLTNTTVNFYRYVDDIYFGYNDPQDLLKIKRALQKLTITYDIELNSKKTQIISYNEINKGSQLLNYFVSIKTSKIISIKNFLNIFNNYFALADKEILAKIKGSKKLLFSSLQYFLHSLNKKNQRNALKALIKTTNDNEFPFLLKIIQLVFDDASIAERFVHLIEEIQKEENILWPKQSQGIVSKYLHKIFTNKPLNNRLCYMLKNDLEQNKSEEAYFIFILMQKFDWNLSIKQFEKILNIDECEENNKYLDNIDDFNWLMILEKLFHIMDNDVNSNNIKFYMHFIDKIQSLLCPQNHCVNNYFETKHWLFKYELIYNYEIGNLNFKKYVNKYYLLSGHGNFTNIFAIKTFDNSSASKVNKFYIGLLKLGFSFSG